MRVEPPSYDLFNVAAIWAARTGHTLRVVSGNDHVHVRGSYHYLGRALDFQSSDMDGLAEWLRAHGWYVLWKTVGHWAHVHADDSRMPG